MHLLLMAGVYSSGALGAPAINCRVIFIRCHEDAGQRVLWFGASRQTLRERNMARDVLTKTFLLMLMQDLENIFVW